MLIVIFVKKYMLIVNIYMLCLYWIECKCCVCTRLNVNVVSTGLNVKHCIRFDLVFCTGFKQTYLVMHWKTI